jgi:hypothetical protein
MAHLRLCLLAGLLWLMSCSGQEQTKLDQANILPGTEHVRLVYRDDFPSQDPATSGNAHPFTAGSGGNLHIEFYLPGFQLSWPTSVVALSLQCASNLYSPASWRSVTNLVAVNHGQFAVAVSTRIGPTT